jgi:hypothetical protein
VKSHSGIAKSVSVLQCSIEGDVSIAPVIEASVVEWAAAKNGRRAAEMT